MLLYKMHYLILFAPSEARTVFLVFPYMILLLC